MNLIKNASQSQGFGLPKFSQRVTFPPEKSLDTSFLGRWIRHPQAVTNTGQFNQISKRLKYSLLSVVSSCFGRHGSGAKETAPNRAFLCSHCLAATRSTKVAYNTGSTLMIYTFLIASRRLSVRNLSRVRKVSVVAPSEARARSQLAGLPLIFISRIITKGERS